MNRHLISLGCVVAAVTATASAARSTPARAQQTSPKTAELRRVTDARRRLGLRSDQAYVQALERTGSKKSVSTWGLAVTKAEQKEINRRQRLGTYVHAIKTAGTRNVAFGGVKVDQAAGGVVIIDIKAPAKNVALSNRLRSLVPVGNPVQIQSVDYSASQVSSVASLLADAFLKRELKSLGVIGIEQLDQEITILVSPTTSPSAVDGLRKLYPQPFVNIKIDNTARDLATRGPRDVNSGPLYGGNFMSKYYGTGFISCTIGYSFMKTTATHYWTATAGHCGDYQDAWYQGYAVTGNHFGNGGLYNGDGQYYAGTTSKCDCQVIGGSTGIPVSAATTSVYTSGGSLYDYTATPTNTSADYYAGRVVCESGAEYAYENNNNIYCDSIYSVNNSYSGENNNIYYTNLVTFTGGNAVAGDSGAPVGSGHDFMGILKGIHNGRTVFSRSTYLYVTTHAAPAY